VKRRRFLAAGCLCGAGLLPLLARAQAQEAAAAWSMPARFARPDSSSEEGGLWALMDREETRLRRSPFAIRDANLQKRVQEMVCRMAGPHCPDVRVHLMRTPYFNANMAPNGMMQVWSGLMLRCDNEAQLAAVLGHEVGHYVQRHSLENLRTAKSHSAAATFLSLFGVVGAIGQLGVLANMKGYSREYESEADRISVVLMRNAGYDAAEAAKIWENLLLEIKARGDSATSSSPLFASHPPAEERKQALTELASAAPGGVTNEAAWQQATQPFLREWLVDEVKRGQREESLALLDRMVARGQMRSEYLYARAETYRLRAKEGDLELALADYGAAAAAGAEPPETHRGLAAVYRTRNQVPEAKESLQRYLELAPNAPDAAMMKSYLEEMVK
jgi:beta-barrel assembly-enhancing protease